MVEAYSRKPKRYAEDTKDTFFHPKLVTITYTIWFVFVGVAWCRENWGDMVGQLPMLHVYLDLDDDEEQENDEGRNGNVDDNDFGCWGGWKMMKKMMVLLKS